MDIFKLISSVFKETWDICIPLFRILVPMVIAIKILKETGFVGLLGRVLEPVMYVTGLPGEMALAWASALVTNLYGGVIAFAALAKGMDLTVAQTTVLCSMMLMAHGFPVELQISKKAGTRIRAMLAFRFVSALIYGILLNVLYKSLGWLQQPVNILYSPKETDASLLSWAVGAVTNLAYIAVIILALVILMKVLHVVGAINLINMACKPMLKLMGIGEQAAYTTMVGFTLGLTYGGGLIIKEAKSGSMSHREVFFALGFMGICHSMVEDTLLMMAIGGHVSGILIIRTVFSIALVGVLMRLSARIPENFFYRWLFVNH